MIAKVKPTLILSRGDRPRAIVLPVHAREGTAKAFGDEAVLPGSTQPIAGKSWLTDSRMTLSESLCEQSGRGNGITLTGTQVVFNDLDWVPAHHWCGRPCVSDWATNTVNVTWSPPIPLAFVQRHCGKQIGKPWLMASNGEWARPTFCETSSLLFDNSRRVLPTPARI